jgi:hypothetical protein
MNNQINEQYLTKLYDEMVLERNQIMLELRNDKELNDVQTSMQKIKLLETIIINIIKYRNLKIKMDKSK